MFWLKWFFRKMLLAYILDCCKTRNVYTEYKYLTAMVFGPLGWLKADNWSAVSRKGNEGQCLGRDLSQGQGKVWRQELTNISFIVKKRGNALSWSCLRVKKSFEESFEGKYHHFYWPLQFCQWSFISLKGKCVLITSLFLRG